MSTLFSVNLNKLALIRNSRGTDNPNLLYFVKRLLDLGVKGFTVHPRPDERHIRYQDVYDINDYLKNSVADYPDIEFNIEGNPNAKFLDLIQQVKPQQCTLVPDSVDQLTSDHGYDIIKHHRMLTDLNQEFSKIGVRCAVFVDPNIDQVQAAIDHNLDAIELYTETWAQRYAKVKLHIDSENLDLMQSVTADFQACIKLSNTHGLRVNAGHDLNLNNLAELLTLGEVAEVSIGHAFTIECIEQGIDSVVAQYLAICR